MDALDLITATLFGAACGAAVRALWLAVTTPGGSLGRANHTAEWATAALLLTGCAVYVWTVWDGAPPQHPGGAGPGAPWWQLASVAGVVALAATVVAAVPKFRRVARILRRRHQQAFMGDRHMEALCARHDVVRERFGAYLLADPVAAHADRLAAVLAEAADLRPEAPSTYAARAAYTRAVTAAEDAWRDVRHQDEP